jgi:putative AbiEi antitoxin of type IV toxin-antitoxin system
MMNRPEAVARFQGQHGVASRDQLLELGIDPKTIWRARQRDVIEEVLPGVFALAGTTLSFEGRCMAALLYFGDDAYLSGTTSAALQGCRSMFRRIIDVTVDETEKVRPHPDWIHVHRSAWRLDGDVVTRSDGLRHSSPCRTSFDLASQFNDHRFSRLMEDLWHLKLLTPEEASDYLASVRRSGRAGVKRLEEWLEATGARSRPAQSGLELDVIDAIRAVGLPEPERQHPVRLLSGEIVHIDVAWPAIKFGLEPGDSWWHGGDLKVRADIDRDNACAELGWMIRRLDESLRANPPATARLVKRLYEARTCTYRPAS